MALEVVGSSPTTHPTIMIEMGCSQVVRHGTLTPAFAGSSPATPAIFDPLAQLAEHLPFKQGVRGSNPRRVTSSEIPNTVPFPALPKTALCWEFLRFPSEPAPLGFGWRGRGYGFSCVKSRKPLYIKGLRDFLT